MKIVSILLFFLLLATLFSNGCVQTEIGSSDQTSRPPEIIKQPEAKQQPEVSKQTEIKAEIPLNLFEAASPTSTVLGDVSKGEVLEIIETEGKWSKVKTSSGKQGWVYAFTRSDMLNFQSTLLQGRTDDVERWLDMGMSMHAVYDNHALFLVVGSERDFENKTAIMLINRGAEVNIRDDNDLTPLHVAAWFCTRTNPDVVKKLIEAGADVNAKSTKEVQGYFSSKDYETNTMSKTKEVLTPLIRLEQKLASGRGTVWPSCAEIKQLLLAAGADTSIKHYPEYPDIK